MRKSFYVIREKFLCNKIINKEVLEYKLGKSLNF